MSIFQCDFPDGYATNAMYFICNRQNFVLKLNYTYHFRYVLNSVTLMKCTVKQFSAQTVM